MAAQVDLKRKGDQVQLTIQMNLPPGTPMLECEEAIRKALDAAGRELTRESLRYFDTDGSAICLGGIRLTTKGPVEKAYQSPYGEVRLKRHVYQSSEGGRTFCPLDQAARIVNSTTPRFARMCAFKYTAMSSSLAQMDLEQNHGRAVSRCYLQDTAEAVALIARAKEEAWEYTEAQVPSREVWRVALGVDGACLCYCEEGWRVAMVGTISLYDCLGERLHTTYVGAPPEYGKERFYQEMEKEIERYKGRYPKAEWVGLADGAADHWPWLQKFVERLILDFWHAAEYLEGASAGMCPKRALRPGWFDRSRDRLRDEVGAARELLGEMKRAIEENKPRGEARKGLQAAIRYFQNHLDRMDYGHYRKLCLPIGSGVTEAACKTLVKQRMCGSGMKWKEAGAAAVLRMRSLVLTDGRWEQFWSKLSRFGF
jgi:hypothetical protein